MSKPAKEGARRTRARNTDPSIRAFRVASKAAAAEPYDLCLFIAGTTSLSSTALANVVAICEERLKGRYELVVVDVYQEPARAKADQIVAVPTLLRRRPLPVRRLIGDLSDRAQVLAGLNLPLEPAPGHEEKTH